MRDAAFMVSWGQIAPGREKEGLALFQKSQSFWEKQEKDGKVKRVGPFFLGAGSGAPEDMGGFTLYLGRLDTLHAIVASKEYEAIYYPALQLLHNLKTRLFIGGTQEEVARVVGDAMAYWQASGILKG
ncbi:MAG: hypothetical protein HY002_03545 [Candidatus Rokubacteria bacterium]|nr:hypothetical protein [Candidatus Rokubacteria bacterium]